MDVEANCCCYISPFANGGAQTLSIRIMSSITVLHIVKTDLSSMTNRINFLAF
jgi:hypothetical protein